MTRTNGHDRLREADAYSELQRRASHARDSSCDFLRDCDDLAPARPFVWLLLAYLAAVAAIAAILMLPGVAQSKTPPRSDYPTGTAPAPVVNTATATGGTGGQSTAISSTTTTNTLSTSAGASSQSGAVTGPVTAGNNLSLDARMAQAPDVISYPTAPCRVAIGAGGGWLGGALGFTGSVEDTACTLRETSRQLHNLGQRDAAVQVMCLNDDARAALEAVGVSCRIARPAAAGEVVKP